MTRPRQPSKPDSARFFMVDGDGRLSELPTLPGLPDVPELTPAPTARTKPPEGKSVAQRWPVWLVALVAVIGSPAATAFVTSRQSDATSEIASDVKAIGKEVGELKTSVEILKGDVRRLEIQQSETRKRRIERDTEAASYLVESKDSNARRALRVLEGG